MGFTPASDLSKILRLVDAAIGPPSAHPLLRPRMGFTPASDVRQTPPKSKQNNASVGTISVGCAVVCARARPFSVLNASGSNLPPTQTAPPLPRAWHSRMKTMSILPNAPLLCLPIRLASGTFRLTNRRVAI
ncbi:unnamed protein product [Cyclocybe aegerita]|uniref:Uncharacterized protein n=1 Tax=Cyclocybe aegerita TaxID=1973307 RepID=A0A8S0X9F8_CYCAE|nr:unnamed protein product [Cyclocybe aegerita]